MRIAILKDLQHSSMGMQPNEMVESGDAGRSCGAVPDFLTGIGAKPEEEQNSVSSVKSNQTMEDI